MINLSLKLLDCEEVREQILKDIDSLLDIAKDKKMKPVILVIGNIFVDVGIMRTLRETISPLVLCDEVDNNPQYVSDLFKMKKLDSYKKYEQKSGDFSSEEEKRFKVFFDPEEDYMCLIVADPSKKAEIDESQTADNFPYYFLKFRSDEVLDEFCDKFLN